MDAKILAKTIAVLETPAEEEEALLAALLLLLAILQQPTTYSNSKARPTTEFQDLVHWALLAFSPISQHLANRGQITLSSELTARRELHTNGKFVLHIEGLFPLLPKDERISYEYDVCISFAGEQRSLAESIATKLKDEFYLRVFYDDFEKLKLWGRDLFSHLYEVYSRKSQYCIILFSQAYLAKNWTAHELRAAQSRVLKERTPYVLPVLTEPNIRPPAEFENIAYITLDPANLEPLCLEVNERVWAVQKNHLVTVDEIAEIINEDFQFKLSFSPFREKMANSQSHGEQMLVFLLGLAWSCSKDRVSKHVMGLVEYLLFAFPPVAKRFDNDDEIVIVPPDGTIRRVIGAADGAMFMPQSFWKPILARWKKDYPQMFPDSESTDGSTSDESLDEPGT